MQNYVFLNNMGYLCLLSALFIEISLLIPSQAHWKRRYPCSVGRCGAAKSSFALGGEYLLYQGSENFRLELLQDQSEGDYVFTSGNKSIFSHHSFHLRSPTASRKQNVSSMLEVCTLN